MNLEEALKIVLAAAQQESASLGETIARDGDDGTLEEQAEKIDAACDTVEALVALIATGEAVKN